VLVLQFYTGRCSSYRARPQASRWPAADHVLTRVFCLPEQCENRHVLRSQNGFLRYRLQTRRLTAAFLRPANVRCRLLAASSAALLRRDTSLAQCQRNSSSAQVTVVSICIIVFSVVTRLQAELFGVINTFLLLSDSETGFLTQGPAEIPDDLAKQL